MKPTRTLAALIYALLLLGLLTLDADYLILAFPLLIYLTAGLAFGPRKLDLVAERTLSDERAPQDTPVEVSLAIHNHGPDLEHVHLEDRLPPGLEVQSGESAYLGPLAAGGSVNVAYTVSASRGYFPFESVRVEASDHFGILQLEESLPATGRLFLLPAALRLRRLPLRPLRTSGFAGPIPSRRGGPGLDFHGIRDYQPGDPLRWVHWRGIARHPDRFFTKEFEQERTTEVGLILDARQRSNLRAGKQQLFEHSVRAATSLAETLLKQGNRVGLLLYGKVLDWTFPGYGKIQRERILQSLARATPGESMAFEQLDNLPVRYFPARSQLVLVSPLHRDDVPWLVGLKARGYELLVISPDPVHFEYGALRAAANVQLAARIASLERSMVLDRLRRAGIQLMEWKVSVPFEHAARSALHRSPPRYPMLKGLA